MKTGEKLNIILQISGLTQEKLAHKWGVSFATINSWVNGRSVPREGSSKRIDAFYFELTKQTKIPKSGLLAKRQIIEDNQKKIKRPLNLILTRPDLNDEFVLTLTYNTNRIEGSTLTEPETAAVLFDNISLANKNIIELMEVKNHQMVLKSLLEHLLKDKKIDEAFILGLHRDLMHGIRQDAGLYRNHGVRIVGSNVPTANYLKVPALMKEIIKQINVKRKDAIGHVAQIHSRFEQIHPFSDGNGRIGRLLIHAMLLKQNLPPAVIKQEKKRAYIKCLNESQLKGEFDNLESFIADAVMMGFDIIEKAL
jgi:Fic family protein